MKKLIVVAALWVIAGAASAQERQAKKPAAPKEQKVAAEKAPQAAVKELEPNTRGWLYRIRVKVYGFEPGRKAGKEGC